MAKLWRDSLHPSPSRLTVPTLLTSFPSAPLPLTFSFSFLFLALTRLTLAQPLLQLRQLLLRLCHALSNLLHRLLARFTLQHPQRTIQKQRKLPEPRRAIFPPGSHFTGCEFCNENSFSELLLPFSLSLTGFPLGFPANIWLT